MEAIYSANVKALLRVHLEANQVNLKTLTVSFKAPSRCQCQLDLLLLLSLKIVRF